jgi:hypothetical protein
VPVAGLAAGIDDHLNLIRRLIVFIRASRIFVNIDELIGVVLIMPPVWRSTSIETPSTGTGEAVDADACRRQGRICRSPTASFITGVARRKCSPTANDLSASEIRITITTSTSGVMFGPAS